MPETEQRSLEEIERHYSDNTKGITDIYIPKSSYKVKRKNEHTEFTKCIRENE